MKWNGFAGKSAKSTDMDQEERFDEDDLDSLTLLPLKKQTVSYSESKNMPVSPKVFKERRFVAALPDTPEGESYKILRTQIQQRTKDGQWSTIMITSPNQGAGKTLTAINLAISMAQEFHQTVMLVDCDLRKQSIHKLLDYPSERGLADHLLEGVPLSELIVSPGINKLTLISGGKTIEGSTELLGSTKMEQLVLEMKYRYQNRFILFDMPSILQGADALAFMPYVDAVVLVVESGRTTLSETKSALDLISRDKLLGIVLNRQVDN